MRANIALDLGLATAQGKQGIWMVIFSDGENREISQNIKKYFFTKGIDFHHGEIFKLKKLKNIPGLGWNTTTIFWLCSKF